jgi:5-methyltetrahydrofolate--homocysteine methyltransferase
MIYKPKHKGIKILQDIDLKEVSDYINWTYFFLAWRISGKYEDIEKVCLCASCEAAFLQKIEPEDKEKAKEALSLFRDAQLLLADIVKNKLFSINAVFSIEKAKSENEGIVFYTDNGKEVYIPMLRQQQEKTSGYFLSLADFVSPVEDYVGVFAVSVHGSDKLKEKFNSEDDTYHALLVQTIADRLAEAATEWLHLEIRKKYWGYAPDESLTVKELFKSKYQGIRPAVGYPSLPDQSVIFSLNEILNLSQIGIKITENGAMHPTASTCGLMISQPKAVYFMVGKIGDDQLKDYARRKNISVEDARKWLSVYL